MNEVPLLRDLTRDAMELTRVALRVRRPKLRDVVRVALRSDSFHITALTRVRESARRRTIPAVNHLLRRVQTVIYGVEIGSEVKLGRGVWFVHPVGVVIGGDARIGDRVRFMGSNTIGEAKGDGRYPTIGSDVIVGCGARVLGDVRVGARAVIGANAVVLHDVPADTTVVGAPARAVPKKASYELS